MKKVIFAALLLASGASQAAVLVWGCTPTTHDTKDRPLTVPLTYKVYWGTTPTTRLHNEQPLNCTTPTSIEVPGPPGVMHYLAVRAETVGTAKWSDYSNGLNLQSVAATPPPAKVDCVVSAWSSSAVTPWTPAVCAGNGQSRQETRTRTVSTPASGGGAACPALSETKTVTQPCTVPKLQVVDNVGYQINLGSKNKISLSRVAAVPLGKECIESMSATDPYRKVYIIKDRNWAVMDPDPKKPGKFFTLPNQVWANCEVR